MLSGSWEKDLIANPTTMNYSSEEDQNLLKQ
jgi:hypothetical protein